MGFKMAENSLRKLSDGSSQCGSRLIVNAAVDGPFISHMHRQCRPFQTHRTVWLNLSFKLTLSWETGTRTVSPEFNSFVSTGPSSIISI